MCQSYSVNAENVTKAMTHGGIDGVSDKRGGDQCVSDKRGGDQCVSDVRYSNTNL